MGEDSDTYGVGAEAPPSRLTALLCGETEEPTPDATIERLRELGLSVGDAHQGHHPEIEGADWWVDASIHIPGRESGPLVVTVWREISRELGDIHVELGHLNPDELEASHKSEFSLGVSLALGEDPLADFHAQLELLWRIAPTAVVLFDVDGCRARPADWLRETVETEVPPPPSCLYSIHSVHDGSDDGTVWLHTHGLHRCGSIELEILDVPRNDVRHVTSLLETAAAMFIESGPEPPETPFFVGDGIDLLWVPWEDGVSKVATEALGTERDRDQYHSGPSGILFAPGGENGNLEPVCRYTELLAGDPLLYVTHMETERMRLLARERVHKFAHFQKLLGEHRDWTFMVKLGYVVDDAEHDSQREHLWFEVHSIIGSEVDATLLNQPYRVARLECGDRRRHSLELLTDWSIGSPFGSHGPGSVLDLERALDDSVRD